jgi:hypothetical protein
MNTVDKAMSHLQLQFNVIQVIGEHGKSVEMVLAELGVTLSNAAYKLNVNAAYLHWPSGHGACAVDAYNLIMHIFITQTYTYHYYMYHIISYIPISFYICTNVS